MEHNPLAYPILARHRVWFVAASLMWAMVFGTVIVLLRNRVLDWLAVLLAFGHALGDRTWLARHGVGGLLLTIVYLTFAS